MNNSFISHFHEFQMIFSFLVSLLTILFHSEEWSLFQTEQIPNHHPVGFCVIAYAHILFPFIKCI